MNANELMTGDWILYGGKPVRVLQLSEGRDYKQISPIPLTVEIFKKNGFDCSDKEIAQLYFEDGDYKGHFSLRAMYDKSGNQKGWSFYAFNVLTILDYVHELQHALKICKIDKDIVLPQL